jgi:hypothetical protein
MTLTLFVYCAVFGFTICGCTKKKLAHNQIDMHQKIAAVEVANRIGGGPLMFYATKGKISEFERLLSQLSYTDGPSVKVAVEKIVKIRLSNGETDIFIYFGDGWWQFRDEWFRENMQRELSAMIAHECLRDESSILKSPIE